VEIEQALFRNPVIKALLLNSAGGSTFRLRLQSSIFFRF
jgi:hypothetical protein